MALNTLQRKESGSSCLLAPSVVMMITMITGSYFLGSDNCYIVGKISCALYVNLPLG